MRPPRNRWVDIMSDNWAKRHVYYIDGVPVVWIINRKDERWRIRWYDNEGRGHEARLPEGTPTEDVKAAAIAMWRCG